MRSRGQPRSHTPLSGDRDNEQLTIFCRRKGNASSRTSVTNRRASFTRRGFILGAWRADGVSDTMEGETEARGGSPDRAEAIPASLCNKEAQDGCFLPSLVSLFSPLPSFSPFLFCFLPFLPSCFLSSRLCPPQLYFFVSLPLCLCHFISLSDKVLWDFQRGRDHSWQWKSMEGFLEEVAFVLGILRIIGRGLPRRPSG